MPIRILGQNPAPREFKALRKILVNGRAVCRPTRRMRKGYGSNTNRPLALRKHHVIMNLLELLRIPGVDRDEDLRCDLSDRVFQIELAERFTEVEVDLGERGLEEEFVTADLARAAIEGQGSARNSGRHGSERQSIIFFPELP